MPFTLGSSLGGIVASLAGSRLKIPSIVIVALGIILQVLGTCLLATSFGSIDGNVFGFELLIGCGTGIVFGILTIVSSQLIKGKDQRKFVLALSQRVMLTP